MEIFQLLLEIVLDKMGLFYHSGVSCSVVIVMALLYVEISKVEATSVLGCFSFVLGMSLDCWACSPVKLQPVNPKNACAHS